MAAAGLRDILEAMADQIAAALVDVEDVDLQVESRYVLQPGSAVCIDLYPGDPAAETEAAAFDDVYGAWLITVRARIGTQDFDASYDVLISLLDDQDDLCLPIALTDDPTLNGYATSLHVRDVTGLRAYELPSGDGAHLGFQFTAVVIAGES